MDAYLGLTRFYTWVHTSNCSRSQTTIRQNSALLANTVTRFALCAQKSTVFSAFPGNINGFVLHMDSKLEMLFSTTHCKGKQFPLLANTITLLLFLFRRAPASRPSPETSTGSSFTWTHTMKCSCPQIIQVESVPLRLTKSHFVPSCV